MATKKKARRRSWKHPGVKVLSLPGRGLVCRWKDPINDKVEQLTMSRLDITSRPQADVWAANKAKDLAKLAKARSEGKAIAGRVPPRDAVQRYLEDLLESTAKSRGTVLRNLVAFLERSGVSDMASVTGPILFQWRSTFVKRTSKLAKSTQKRWADDARVFLGWAIKSGMTPVLTEGTVKDHLEAPRVPQEAIKFLRPKEVQRILEVAQHDRDPELAAVLLLAFTTGMRLQEITGLRWDEWNRDLRQIDLPASRVKTGKARSIGLDVSPSAGELLLVRSLRGGGQRVFPGWSPKRVDDGRKRLADAGAAKFTMQMARRTVGTVLACAHGVGLTAWSVAKRMGHTVDIAEKHYVGALPGLPADAATIEAAMAIEHVAKRIIEASGGVVRDQVASAAGERHG